MIVWEDHCVIHDPPWVHPEQVEEMVKGVVTIISVGFPVSVTPAAVTLAQSISDDGDLGDLVQILRPCIKKVVAVGPMNDKEARAAIKRHALD